MPAEPTWVCRHSIECAVSLDFAWAFWTNVQNWLLDSDVDSIELDGPFAAGARGVTNSRTSGRLEWRIVVATPGRAVIELSLPGAVGRLTWTFEPAGNRTRITQHWTLEGEQADALAKAFGPSLEAGMPAGMQKLCEAMRSAAAQNRAAAPNDASLQTPSAPAPPPMPDPLPK